MFTGIIEEVGVVAQLREEGGGREFEIACLTVLDGLALGDSMAVDGVCLTVTALLDGAFLVQAIGTTLGRTTLDRFEQGRRVNLERAMALGARLGGHIVQGHVDGVGRVAAVQPRGEHLLIDITLPDDVAQVTVLHGSIAVDGISLTVNELPAAGVAQVAIIPYTLEHTTLGAARVGDAVNLEGDTIGKFVRHLLGSPGAGGARDVLSAWGYGAG